MGDQVQGMRVSAGYSGLSPLHAGNGYFCGLVSVAAVFNSDGAPGQGAGCAEWSVQISSNLSKGMW